MDDDTRDDGVYVPEEELDNQVDKEGEPIDAIEQDQDEEDFQDDESGQAALEDALTDDTDHNDE